MEANNRVDELRGMMISLEKEIGTLSEIQLGCCSLTLAQCHSLREIGKKESVSLIELAKLLHLDNSTISRTVSTLVNCGLVRREIDYINRRYVIITLTEDGLKIFQMIEKTMNTYYRNLLRKIPIEKQEEIINGLTGLLNALQAMKEE